MKQKLQVAILFQRDIQTDTVELALPIRTLVGVLSEDGTKFYDRTGQQVLNDIDNYSDTSNCFGFYYPMPFEDFMTSNTPESVLQNINDYFKKIKEKVYFYKLETGTVNDFRLKSMPIDEFNSKYSITVNYSTAANNITNIDFDLLAKENAKMIGTDLENGETLENYTDSDLDLPDIKELYDKITKNVLCQDAQIKKILTAIYKNILLDNPKLKSNILIYGPSGVGKTAILNQISENLGLPMVIEDATAYTIAGYKGKDCTDALRRLYFAANGDIDLAEHGILVFDEIDKKNKKSSNDDGVSTDGVLNALLKIVEGGTFEVPIDESKNGDIIEFDTSHLTVIVSGAFEKMLNKSKKTELIGFNNPINVNSTEVSNNTLGIVDKFIEYGMPKEFIGRFNTFVELNSLTKTDLKNILLNPDSSVLKLYIKDLADYKINIEFYDQIIERICDLAYAKNTGARALNNIVSELIDSILFEAFQFKAEEQNYVIDNNTLKAQGLEDKKTEKSIVKTKTL